MHEYKFTIIGLVLAVGIYATTFAFKIDLFEMTHELINSLERFEVDEFLIPLFILSLFTMYDQNRRQKLRQIEYEKIKIYKAMLASTHHILNNFINQMQLVKIEAQRTPDFNPKILSIYDSVIKNATMQIEALGSVTKVDEDSIQESVLPK